MKSLHLENDMQLIVKITVDFETKLGKFHFQAVPFRTIHQMTHF